MRAEAEAKHQLKAVHRRFLEEHEPGPKSQASRDLVRAIFGKDSIAEDSVLCASYDDLPALFHVRNPRSERCSQAIVQFGRIRI